LQDTRPSTAATKTAFGSWSSPFSSDLVTAGGVSLTETRIDEGDVYWLEARPLQGGCSTVVRCREDGTCEDVTGPQINVRTRVHEYGGGSYAVRGGKVWGSNFADQLLLRIDDGGSPLRVSPRPVKTAGLRYADASFTPDGSRIVCVRESHEGDGEPVNEIVLLDADGAEPPRVLASGIDFVSSPRVSADGRRLAWISWDHPRMPWDGTELRVADLRTDGSIGEPELVAGGPRESVVQPEWSPDGRLAFVSDRSGWWNLHAWSDGEVVELLPMAAEFAGPHWVFGMSRYAWLSGGRIACVFGDGGAQKLGVLEPGCDEITVVELPYSCFGETLRSDGASRVVFVGSSPTRFDEVVSLDLDGGSPEVLRRGIDLDVEDATISVPRTIEFPTTGDRTAHAFYYPPANPDHRAPDGEKPPLLVMSHGGPTSNAGNDLRLGTQFWTSRGFAVVDVNYSGSTGYGREYRERLQGCWGVADTDDCIAAVHHLEALGEIDASRVAIRGGSAGGYTTLCALTFHDVFAAGASYYGVADLEALVRETHKFESRYLDGLIGPYPEREDLYRERSPIRFAERLSCPVILLQGLEDRVVPPSQAETMVAALAEKGLPHAYLAFEDEQHGFRRAENRRRALEAELYFYARVFGFEAADEIEPLAIENLA